MAALSAHGLRCPLRCPLPPLQVVFDGPRPDIKRGGSASSNTARDPVRGDAAHARKAEYLAAGIECLDAKSEQDFEGIRQLWCAGVLCQLCSSCLPAQPCACDPASCQNQQCVPLPPLSRARLQPGADRRLGGAGQRRHHAHLPRATAGQSGRPAHDAALRRRRVSLFCRRECRRLVVQAAAAFSHPTSSTQSPHPAALLLPAVPQEHGLGQPGRGGAHRRPQPGGPHEPLGAQRGRAGQAGRPVLHDLRGHLCVRLQPPHHR